MSLLIDRGRIEGISAARRSHLSYICGHLHLNEEGLVDGIEVTSRPLPATLHVQEVFASKLSFPAMRLVPASNA